MDTLLKNTLARHDGAHTVFNAPAPGTRRAV